MGRLFFKTPTPDFKTEQRPIYAPSVSKANINYQQIYVCNLDFHAKLQMITILERCRADRAYAPLL